MDELQELIERETSTVIDTVMEGLPARTVTEARLRAILTPAMQRVSRDGENYALTSLMTVEDVAAILGISARRVRAIAKNRHERFGTGWQVPGTTQWLFRPSEIDLLQPDAKYRRK